MTLSHLTLLLAGLALAPQEGGAQGPQINVQSPAVPASGGARDIPDVREYRGYESVPYIRRIEDVRDLDLSKVDYSAPVLARINGHDVTQDEYRLWLAFTGGQNGVLRAQLVTLTHAMSQRIVADGGDPASFEVAQEEVDRRIQDEEDMARAQGEEMLTAYYQRIEDTLGMDRYREFVRAHLLSEKLLLPPIKPLEEVGEGLQALPVEAAELLEAQPQMREYLNNAYMTGQDFPAMFRTQFLRMLQEEMIKRAEIRYAVEEAYGSRFAADQASPLADGVYMSIDGVDVPVSDILPFVPKGTEVREYALRLLLLYRAADDVLAAADALISPAEFELIFEAHEAEYEGTLFPLRNLISLRGFLNMPEYREYYRRRAAFQRMHEASMDPAALEAALMAHQQLYGKLFYQSGKLTVETVFSSLQEAAVDGAANGDSSAAWAAARERIERAYGALMEGKTFAEVRESTGNPHPNEPTGVLVGKMRNEIRNAIGETEYAIFVAGYSLADDLFYNRVPGEKVGPVALARSLLPGLKGGLGYMVAEVTGLQITTPLKPFEQQKPLVLSDYYDLQYIYWAHECLKNAEIELVEAG